MKESQLWWLFWITPLLALVAGFVHITRLLSGDFQAMIVGITIVSHMILALHLGKKSVKGLIMSIVTNLVGCAVGAALLIINIARYITDPSIGCRFSDWLTIAYLGMTIVPIAIFIYFVIRRQPPAEIQFVPTT